MDKDGNISNSKENHPIEVENPTDRNALGYFETQWDEVPAIPADSGYLGVDYRGGTFKFPHEELVLCDIAAPGTIVAHWLQLNGDHSLGDDEGVEA